MFSKYATILAFAASVIAGAIEPGVHRISNFASHSSARSYQAGTPVYVSSTREAAGPFELVGSASVSALKYILILCLKLQWDIKDSEDDSYTLRNVGLNIFAAVSVVCPLLLWSNNLSHILSTYP